ncbi:hypothetical protein [Murdochiella massiliensis]|uniref:hypothetical protein n=1 Tax=Murdochiella massiliensis TaxID=1673723 RepID=UPI00083693DC|nr:hypothetical protein [Murdochiella massiliensis]
MRKNKSVRVILILVFALLMASCGDSKVREEKSIQNSTSTTETIEINSTSEMESSEESRKYAEDEVVDTFIKNYNSFSDSPIEHIEKGNIRTKYFGVTHDYWVEMINAADTNKIVVTIDKTDKNRNLGMEGMKEVFHDAIQAIIPDAGIEEINNYFDHLVSNEYMVTEEAFNQLEILFCPDTERSPGHIEIRSK